MVIILSVRNESLIRTSIMNLHLFKRSKSYEDMIGHRSYTHDLSSFEIKAGFNFTTASVVCITAMISHVFIPFSAVQLYDLSYIHLRLKSFWPSIDMKQLKIMYMDG